jgi:hypothetical protein
MTDKTDRELMQQALEALEWEWGGEPLGTKTWAAIGALRARLAQPEQKAVAWECKAGGLRRLTQRQYEAQPDNIKRHYTRIEPEQERREWQGLTDEEIQTTWDSVMDGAVFTRREVYKAIEAKLKEKND